MRADTVGSLLQTIRSGDVDTAKRMLLTQQFTGINNQASRKDGTPLYWSCCHGYRDLVELLLLNGADVNLSTSWGSTPLHASVDHNRGSILTLLLQFNADVDRQTKTGDTALHLACYRGYAQCAQHLVEKGANIELRNKKRRTPMAEAYGAGSLDIYNYLKAVRNLYRTRNMVSSTESHSTKQRLARPELEYPDESYCTFRLNGSMTSPYCSDINNQTLNEQCRGFPHDTGVHHLRAAVTSESCPVSEIRGCNSVHGRQDTSGHYSSVQTSSHKDTSVKERPHDNGQSVIGVLRIPQADFVSNDLFSTSSTDSTFSNDLSSTFMGSNGAAQMTFKNI